MINVDIRTLPGDEPDDVDAHLRAALGDLADHVEVEIIMNDPASIVAGRHPAVGCAGAGGQPAVPDRSAHPAARVGFTDARIYREMGAIAYGAGLFSPGLNAADFGSRFHGHDERIDVESLALTTRLWHRVATDFLG